MERKKFEYALLVIFGVLIPFLGVILIQSEAVWWGTLFLKGYVITAAIIAILLAIPMYRVYLKTHLRYYLILPTAIIFTMLVFIQINVSTLVGEPIKGYLSSLLLITAPCSLIFNGASYFIRRREREKLLKLWKIRKKLPWKDQLLGKVPNEWDRK